MRSYICMRLLSGSGGGNGYRKKKTVFLYKPTDSLCMPSYPGFDTRKKKCVPQISPAYVSRKVHQIPS